MRSHLLEVRSHMGGMNLFSYERFAFTIWNTPFCRDLTQVKRLTLVGWFFSYKQFLTLRQHLVYCGADTSSASEDMYFISHVTQQDHFVEMSCVFMGERSWLCLPTLKRLGILIVKRKNASSKTLSWLGNHKARKKCHKHKKGILWEEVLRN